MKQHQYYDDFKILTRYQLQKNSPPNGLRLELGGFLIFKIRKAAFLKGKYPIFLTEKALDWTENDHIYSPIYFTQQ